MADRAEQKAALEVLHNRIVAENRGKTWFWCEGFGDECHGISGFLGAAPLIITGLAPATGFNPATGKLKNSRSGTTYGFFFDLLREEGLEDAHLSDLFKVRTAKKDVPLLLYNPEMINLHKGYFLEEAQIVRPTILVALGTEVFDVLRGWGLVAPNGNGWIFNVPGGGNATVVSTVHPAATRWPQRTTERQARFRQDIHKARQQLDGSVHPTKEGGR